MNRSGRRSVVDEVFRSLAVPLALALGAVTAAGPALADSFGGFSADETRYLVGRDTVCKPLAPGDEGAPSCGSIDTRGRAEARFSKPAALRGRGAYSASASGTTLRVLGSSGKAVRTWSTLGVIKRVENVYLSPRGKMLAVEYQVREMGRSAVQVVGFELPRAGKGPVTSRSGSASGTAGQRATGASGKLVVGRKPRPAKLARALKIGKRHLARQRWGAARKHYQDLAARHPDDPAVLYGIAASYAGPGKLREAVAALEKLGALDHPEVPIYMVDARGDRAFKRLRRDGSFRRAIGLDPGGRQPSAYERAVGLGGRWEQPGSPCAEPKVDLALSTGKTQSFRLVIASRCQGGRDRTRLSGTWTAQGKDDLNLIFPNPGADDEVLACELSACQGVDCLTCGAGTDMEFALKATRR